MIYRYFPQILYPLYFNIQVVGAPINIIYEEGTAISSGLTSSYASITKVTIGDTSILFTSVWATIKLFYFKVEFKFYQVSQML